MPHVRQCQLCMSMRQQSQIMSTTLNTFRPEGYIDQQKQHLTVIQMGKQLVSSDVIRCCWQGIRSVWDQYLIGQCIIGTASKTRDKVICCLCVYSKQMTTIQVLQSANSCMCHFEVCAATSSCIQVFELMLGTNKLMTSFDAINVLAPHNEPPPAGWLHVDQTPLRPHFACLQGLVNLVDVSAETSGALNCS